MTMDSDDDLRLALDERHARRTQYRKYPDRNQRPEHYRWYHLARWAKVRRHHFRLNPFCVMCKEQYGFEVVATICDHIVPPRGDEKLFWNPKNLQGLCQDHHDSGKKQIEHRGYVEDVGPDGFKIDPNHPMNILDRKMRERDSKEEMAARRKR